MSAECLLRALQAHRTDVMRTVYCMSRLSRPSDAASAAELTAKQHPLHLACRYIPSPDGINQNLLLLLHGLGDTSAGFTGEGGTNFTSTVT